MNCEDCAHEKVCEGYSNCEEAGLCEPKRPHGEWVKGEQERVSFFVRKCSQCGEKGAVGDYCMWCGSDMRKSGENE